MNEKDLHLAKAIAGMDLNSLTNSTKKTAVTKLQEKVLRYVIFNFKSHNFFFNINVYFT